MDSHLGAGWIADFRYQGGGRGALGREGGEQGHRRRPATQRSHLKILVQHLKVRWWDFLFPALFRSRVGAGAGQVEGWTQKEHACKMIRLLGCEA